MIELFNTIILMCATQRCVVRELQPHRTEVHLCQFNHEDDTPEIRLEDGNAVLIIKQVNCRET